MIRVTIVSTVFALLTLLSSSTATAEWAAKPGETVRDAFGPAMRGQARMCRGACGVGCPSACTQKITYECIGEELLRKVRAFTCGTHEGCREHDDCLDRCTQRHGAKFDCDTQCHSEAVAKYGLETALSWAGAGGPFDREAITFEYTREAPGDPSPAFRCPEGASLACTGDEGRCLADNQMVAPVFDSYPSTDAAAMRISNFKAGPLCGDKICKQATDIRVSGEDTCDRGDGPTPCTRYGLEFDYRNADPSRPLECSTSTSGGDSDFIGDLIKTGFDSAGELNEETFEGNPGLGQLLGMFQKVVASADSPEDVEVSITPFGADGKPIESQRVGTKPRSGPPPVPSTVDLPESSGHLVVPMYQIVDTDSGSSTKVRTVRCSHQGVPVLEATFRLLP